MTPPPPRPPRPKKAPPAKRPQGPLPKEVALARGRAAERRVLDACRSPQRPAWLLTARLASRAEDRRGIDLVLETDVGRLFLQVKSSRRGMAGFLEKKRMRRIAIVVARPYENDAAVLARVVLAVGAVRAIYLEEAAHRLAMLGKGPPPLP